MPKKKKRVGIGAVCTVKSRMLHPRKLILEKLENETFNGTMKGLIAVKQHDKTLMKKFDIVFFKHPTFSEQIIHAAKYWVKIETEGSPVNFLR